MAGAGLKGSIRFVSIGFAPAVALLLACIGGSARERAALARPPAAAGPFSDFRGQSPGTVHLIRAGDLPPSNATPSADNPPRVIPRPKGAWPKAPPGFKVELYADGLSNPRLLRVAPNGDVLVAESKQDRVRILRGRTAAGRAELSATFADGLNRPFGIAFFPPAPPAGADAGANANANASWVYVANTDSVVRFPYRAGDTKARGKAETVVADLPGGGLLRGGGHWTRDIAFTSDGQKMLISVGSRSNVDDPDVTPAERQRADILQFKPDGSDRRVFATGIRNAVGIAISPRSGALWASVNERDGLGDDLVPDYITRVRQGGFYGWPWFYIGANQDPRHPGKRPDLKDKVIVPDVLVQPHNASLQMLLYEGTQFPPAYRGDIFAAQHGSWNRTVRTGYEVIRVPLHGKDQATGEYEDFLTGFVTDGGEVWGRPVGVAVAGDGALLVSDDGGNCIWRVSYTGAPN